MTLDATFTLSPRIFGPSVCSLSVTGSLTPALTLMLLDILLHKALPAELFTQSEVRNLKGRDRTEVLRSDLPPPEEGEIVYIEGEFSESIEERSEDSEHDSELYPAAVSVHGTLHFDRWEKRTELAYHPSLEVHSPVPFAVPVQLLGKLHSFIPHAFRVARAEIGASRGFIFLLATPKVVARLLVDCVSNNVSLRFEIEKGRVITAHFQALTNEIVNMLCMKDDDACARFLSELEPNP